MRIMRWLAQSGLFDRLPRGDRGATAVEYGLVLSLVAAVIATAVATLGTHVLASFALMSGLWP